jgi:hypothetical protein
VSLAQLRQDGIDGIVQPELAFLDEHHAATAVIGLVTEAKRKIVSRRIGAVRSNARDPIASTCSAPAGR